jgi:hypothetical protein
MHMAVMVTDTSPRVILMASRTTVISTGSRGTGTISRPDRIGRTIGNLTTIPIIAGARRVAVRRLHPT